MTNETAAIWRKNILVWAALLLLLALTFGIAHLRLGTFGTAAGLAIAGMKAALVLLVFMGLRRSRGLSALAAGAGVFWLSILFVLAFSDVLSRPQ